MTFPARISTGVPGLDQQLGGGLLPGTLTAVVGATGIGKTQFGLQFAAAGAAQEGPRGIFFDLSFRGDSQNHQGYAQRLCGWQLRPTPADQLPPLDEFFSPQHQPGDYLRVFSDRGFSPMQRDDFDAERVWRAELVRKLDVAISFFYGNFCRGVRRAVIDGLDPTDRPTLSVQFEFFAYAYQQILRKESDWVARDLFRQSFREHADAIARHAYDPAQIACVLLYTSAESLLDDLIAKPLAEGDWLANANTVLYLGKVRRGQRLERALYIAKHRGSAAAETILPFALGEQGMRLCDGT